MADINVTPTNAVRSVGGTSQKNINNETGRPNRSIENMRQGQKGRISNAGANTQGVDSSYLDKLNNIRENAVKTVNTDIIQKALKDADVQITQDTLDIVKSLVSGSLPLTEKNIVDLLEYSRIFKAVSTDTLALMMRLEIPITAENIEQFEKLIGADEKLSDTISELINKLPQEVLQNSRNLPELSENLSKLLDIVANKEARETALPRENQGNENMRGQPVLTRSELSGLLNMLRALKAPDSVLNQIINANRGSSAENHQNITQNTNQNTGGNNIINQNNSQLQPQSQINANPQNNTLQSQNPQTQPQAQIQIQPQMQIQSDVVLNIIKSFITEQSQNINANKQIQNNPQINANETPQNISQPASPAPVIAEETVMFDNLKELINSGAFQKLLKESIESRWLIDPKNFNPEKMEAFYNKLNENLNRIENQFAKLGQNNQVNQEREAQQNSRNVQTQTQSQLNQTQSQSAAQNGNLPQAYLDAKNIRENLSVMNDISKTMPFMQIPVKLTNQIANSDLYIFTNKKKNKDGKNPSGSVNALLRLDLENAGTLDVYINLSGKNVQSRFYSQSEESVSEISKNLPDLDEIISKMGFNFRATASSGEKGFDFVGDFINRGVPKTEVRKYILNLKI